MLETLIELLTVLLVVLYEYAASFVKLFYRPRKDVSGDTVLITGAGSGIGRLVALRFARLGSKVICSDIQEKSTNDTVSMIKKEGGTAYGFVFDVSKREDVYAAAEKIKETIGEVTILINNAGIVSGKKFLDIPDELALKTFEVNSIAHFWTTKAFGKPMFAKNCGHLVYISSLAGFTGTAGLSDYCASKFAVNGFFESLLAEIYVTKSDVNATIVCPYYINTGMFDGIKPKFNLLGQPLEPDYAADRIVDAIITNKEVLIMPRVFHIAIFLKSILPIKASLAFGDFLGILHMMDTFKGRQQQKTE